MSNIVLKPQLRQELRLTPQLLQSMKLLQMNSQELVEYLNQVREENPLIEHEEPQELRREYEALRSKASWLDAGVRIVGGPSGMEWPAAERGRRDWEAESLEVFLVDQLERLHLDKGKLALCRYLARMVDEDGYLSPEDLESLPEKLPKKLVAEALETVQSLDPSGVGARDLSECLVLQLRRSGGSDLAIRIAEDFLPQLGRQHLGAIAKALGVSVAEVRRAEERIASLEPHPGRAFRTEEEVLYVRPDVFIVEVEGELKVVLNEYYLPRITISDYYARLLRESPEKETREYLKEKMQQARGVINGLERRGGTVRRCAERVLEVQRGFFEGRTRELSPMNLASLAQELELHPSTVTRAIRGKYLQCRQGTYPLRYFFSGAVGEAGPSQQAVKQKLLVLIRDEDKAHPLSDQAICEALSTQGVQVARRTVAKYRIALGIPSSTARKK